MIDNLTPSPSGTGFTITSTTWTTSDRTRHCLFEVRGCRSVIHPVVRVSSILQCLFSSPSVLLRCVCVCFYPSSAAVRELLQELYSIQSLEDAGPRSSHWVGNAGLSSVCCCVPTCLSLLPFVTLSSTATVGQTRLCSQV